jgi:hypothetical protein
VISRICIALMMGAVVVGACSPKGEGPAGTPAASSADGPITPVNPIFGKWQLVRAQVAPWWDGAGAEPVADPAVTAIDFEPKSSSGPPIATCAKPIYSVSLVTPAALFQGKLKDPWMDARTLGFLKSDITMLSFSCGDNDKHVELDFPMPAEDTLMLDLDNVIYTLQRTPH